MASGASLKVSEGKPVFDVFVDEVEVVETDLNGAEEKVFLESIGVPDGGLKKKIGRRHTFSILVMSSMQRDGKALSEYLKDLEICC